MKFQYATASITVPMSGWMFYLRVFPQPFMVNSLGAVTTTLFNVAYKTRFYFREMDGF